MIELQIKVRFFLKIFNITRCTLQMKHNLRIVSYLYRIQSNCLDDTNCDRSVGHRQTLFTIVCFFCLCLFCRTVLTLLVTYILKALSHRTRHVLRWPLTRSKDSNFVLCWPLCSACTSFFFAAVLHVVRCPCSLSFQNISLSDFSLFSSTL